MINLDNLFNRIAELELTAKKVSEDTGISTGNISDWKMGRSAPTAIKLNQIADYLGCTTDYLIGRTNDPNNSPAIRYVNEEEHDDEFTKHLKLFDNPVSAGTGAYIGENEPFEMIKVNTRMTHQARRADFALTVKGDSMQPIYYDKDIVFIKTQPLIESGQVGIFLYNGESYIKKYLVNELGVFLVSFNDDYVPIKIDMSKKFECFGVVL